MYSSRQRANSLKNLAFTQTNKWTDELVERKTSTKVILPTIA